VVERLATVQLYPHKPTACRSAEDTVFPDVGAP
jgi:hypothetical protein